MVPRAHPWRGGARVITPNTATSGSRLPPAGNAGPATGPSAAAMRAALPLRTRPGAMACSAGGMVPVLPGLYVGGAEACSSPEALAAVGVVAVLTVDAEEPPAVPGVRAMHVRALDEPYADLLSRLDDCAAFIGAARAGGGAALVRW